MQLRGRALPGTWEALDLILRTKKEEGKKGRTCMERKREGKRRSKREGGGRGKTEEGKEGEKGGEGKKGERRRNSCTKPPLEN